MPSLSKDELASHRAWLSNWRTPAAVADYVGTVNDTMRAGSFFRQGGVEFLRDAWLAAEFGRLRQSQLVRLVPVRDQWPDFEAQDVRDVVERVECAEADIPSRRRGDEYRKAGMETSSGEPHVRDDPVEDWIARADQSPVALCAIIATKIKKRYAGNASLLVYLNITEFGIRQAEIEAAMSPAVMPALACFEHVWILWKSKLYGPWTGNACELQRPQNSL